MLRATRRRTGLKTVVTWTLTPTTAAPSCAWSSRASGPEDDGFYQGAGYGWQKMLAGLERVAAGLS